MSVLAWWFETPPVRAGSLLVEPRLVTRSIPAILLDETMVHPSIARVSHDTALVLPHIVRIDPEKQDAPRPRRQP